MPGRAYGPLQAVLRLLQAFFSPWTGRLLASGRGARRSGAFRGDERAARAGACSPIGCAGGQRRTEGTRTRAEGRGPLAQGDRPHAEGGAVGRRPAGAGPRRRERRPDREPELVGCWMSVGWSVGLGVDPVPRLDRRGARRRRGRHGVGAGRPAAGWDRLSVAGFLADVYCTGIKHYHGPRLLDEREMLRFREYFFGDYKGYQEVPLDLARHLVLGADRTARRWASTPTRSSRGPGALLGDPGRGRRRSPSAGRVQALLRAGRVRRPGPERPHATPDPLLRRLRLRHRPVTRLTLPRIRSRPPCGCPRSSSRRAVEPSSRRAVSGSRGLAVQAGDACTLGRRDHGGVDTPRCAASPLQDHLASLRV